MQPRKRMLYNLAGFILMSASYFSPALALSAQPPGPVPVIFDTDIGSDVDDALALGVLHALQSRDRCRILAVTCTKDLPLSGPFIDLVNTFYGRGDIPVGVVRNGKKAKDSRYLAACVTARDDGRLRYPRTLQSGDDAPEAVGLLRRVLADQPDGSVVFVVVGFSTNIARLLDTPPDAHSELAGRQLVERKCRLLSIMAGMFSDEGRHEEHNVVMDLEAARKVFADWPTPIVASGFEIGQAIRFPAVSIRRDFNYVRHHPLREAYENYLPMPYDRPTWDLTSVLYAVQPDRGYFGLSEPGTIHIDADRITRFTPNPAGRHRYLTVTDEQIVRVREALVQLASQPPATRTASDSK